MTHTSEPTFAGNVIGGPLGRTVNDGSGVCLAIGLDLRRPVVFRKEQIEKKVFRRTSLLNCTNGIFLGENYKVSVRQN